MIWAEVEICQLGKVSFLLKQNTGGLSIIQAYNVLA